MNLQNNRLLFSGRLCAMGVGWLGCADHPFLSLKQSGFLGPDRRRRQTELKIPAQGRELGVSKGGRRSNDLSRLTASQLK